MGEEGGRGDRQLVRDGEKSKKRERESTKALNNLKGNHGGD